MITATTRLLALLGHPVSHSLSPRMQNAAFAARALDLAYVACDVEPDELPAAVAGLRALGFVGANVTIPHKGAVAELCDELDDLSRRSGAVNTLVFREGGRIVAANTDGPAVASAVDAHGAHVLVLGRGGAARAVAAALEEAGAASVRLASRSDPDWPPPAGDATILVNATPPRSTLCALPSRVSSEHAPNRRRASPRRRPRRLRRQGRHAPSRSRGNRRRRDLLERRLRRLPHARGGALPRHDRAEPRPARAHLRPHPQAGAE